ncbi:MAG: hypothetical protein JKX91_09135 [Rhizobiaceae bacterium]|nr:hypothetical protein [Rhizobiaceae bacterium]
MSPILDFPCPNRFGSYRRGRRGIGIYPLRGDGSRSGRKSKVARGLGLNVGKIFALTFAIGSGLASLGGALSIEILSLDPSFGFHILVLVLIVVAVGGLGSVWGSFVAAACLGIFDVMGNICSRSLAHS